MARAHAWTQDEECRLAEGFSRGETDAAIAKEIGRTPAAVRDKAQRMGLKRSGRPLSPAKRERWMYGIIVALVGSLLTIIGAFTQQTIHDAGVRGRERAVFERQLDYAWELLDSGDASASLPQFEVAMQAAPSISDAAVANAEQGVGLAMIRIATRDRVQERLLASGLWHSERALYQFDKLGDINAARRARADIGEGLLKRSWVKAPRGNLTELLSFTATAYPDDGDASEEIRVTCLRTLAQVTLASLDGTPDAERFRPKLQQAYAMLPSVEGTAQKAASEEWLGRAYTLLGWSTKDSADTSLAVAMYSDALFLSPADADAMWNAWLQEGLAEALRQRYRTAGTGAKDLSAAIALCKKTVRMIGDKDAAVVEDAESELAWCYASRGWFTDDVSDLKVARRYALTSVSRCSIDTWPIVWANRMELLATIDADLYEQGDRSAATRARREFNAVLDVYTNDSFPVNSKRIHEQLRKLGAELGAN